MPEFAKRLGCSVALLQSVETLRRPLTWDLAERIGIETGASPTELMRGPRGKAFFAFQAWPYGPEAFETWQSHREFFSDSVAMGVEHWMRQLTQEAAKLLDPSRPEKARFRDYWALRFAAERLLAQS